MSTVKFPAALSAAFFSSSAALSAGDWPQWGRNDPGRTMHSPPKVFPEKSPLPDAASRSDHPRCGGREGKFLTVGNASFTRMKRHQSTQTDVIGGDHNALVAATYLAKVGKAVRLPEARDELTTQKHNLT